MVEAASPSMSPSSPAGTPDTSLELQDDAPKGRRVSGRVRSKPFNYADTTEASKSTNGIKRKRASKAVERAVEGDESGSQPESDDDGEPDEEELREQRKRAKTTAAKKAQASKKKTTMNLPIHAGPNGIQKNSAKPNAAKAPPRQRAAKIAGAEGATGIFGECSHYHFLEP